MAFPDQLRERSGDLSPDGRRWVFVAYDQLNDDLGPLAGADPGNLGIVLVETTWKPSLRPYHRQKLATLLASQRHFALEQAERGVAVDVRFGERPYSALLREAVADHGPLVTMEAAERELRHDLAPLAADGALEVVGHDGWLTTPEEFLRAAGEEPPWRMDAFYRGVRRRTGWLMEDGSPAGGRYSHDGDNRESWRRDRDPAPPTPPTFEPDEITREVGDLVEQRFERHPGRLDLASIPASRQQVAALWSWAKRECMEHFGPFEDAMTVHSTGLFHTRVSPLLNLHRLLPRRVVEDVLELDIPLSSKEGFVRQVAGWREFVRHVHRETDGFRDLPGARCASTPGDGGWGRWRGEEWRRDGADDGGHGGAQISFLGAEAPLPEAFWGTPSGLHCLDRVVGDVWREGWSHHITRLMVLSNLATLLDISPRELTDWFWVAYADAYDWVVEPNVLGMGTFAAGEIMTTKPYVSGAAYIDRMSDYCGECAFHPKRNCPVTRLYWNHLDRHEGVLSSNRRLNLPLASMRRRSRADRDGDARVFDLVSRTLAAGERLEPAALEAALEGPAGD